MIRTHIMQHSKVITTAAKHVVAAMRYNSHTNTAKHIQTHALARTRTHLVAQVATAKRPAIDGVANAKISFGNADVGGLVPHRATGRRLVAGEVPPCSFVVAPPFLF